MESFLRAIESWWQPHPGQREFLACDAKIRVLACGRRWGKTDACAAAVAAELVGPEPSRCLILAPTLDQSKLLFHRIAWMLSKVLDESEFVVSRSPYPKLVYGESAVSARSGHVGSSLRGNEATHVLVDEAAYVPEELVTEVAMPMLATNNGRLTLISTPSGLNHFWKFFRMGQDREHGVWSRNAPSSESPHVSPEFLEVQRQLISQRAYDVEYEAQFVEAKDAVFPSEVVEACLVPEIPSGLRPGAIGVDWARYEDFTAVAAIEVGNPDAYLVELQEFNNQTWAKMVDQAAEIAARYPLAKLAADGSGVGDPVIELFARVTGRKVEPVKFDARTKSELIEGLRIKLERQRLRLPSHPELIKQLKHFRTTLSAHGNRKMNAQSGYHDDLVIALAIAASQLPASYAAPIHLGSKRTFAGRSGLRFEDLVWGMPAPTTFP